jgi:hypothetical protein
MGSDTSRVRNESSVTVTASAEGVPDILCASRKEIDITLPSTEYVKFVDSSGNVVAISTTTNSKKVTLYSGSLSYTKEREGFVVKFTIKNAGLIVKDEHIRITSITNNTQVLITYYWHPDLNSTWTGIDLLPNSARGSLGYEFYFERRITVKGKDYTINPNTTFWVDDYAFSCSPHASDPYAAQITVSEDSRHIILIVNKSGRSITSFMKDTRSEIAQPGSCIKCVNVEEIATSNGIGINYRSIAIGVPEEVDDLSFLITTVSSNQIRIEVTDIMGG